jgi:hypothetical protein
MSSPTIQVKVGDNYFTLLKTDLDKNKKLKKLCRSCERTKKFTTKNGVDTYAIDVEHPKVFKYILNYIKTGCMASDEYFMDMIKLVSPQERLVVENSLAAAVDAFGIEGDCDVKSYYDEAYLVNLQDQDSTISRCYDFGSEDSCFGTVPNYKTETRLGTCVCDGDVYIFTTGEKFGHMPKNNRVELVIKYSPSTRSWETLKTLNAMPHMGPADGYDLGCSIKGGGVVAIGTNIYLVGTNGTVSFDTVTCEWTKCTETPLMGDDLDGCICACNDSIYLFCGQHATEKTEKMDEHCVYKFDTKSSKWTTLDSVLPGDSDFMYGHRACMYKELIRVAGIGVGGCEVLSFDPKTDTFVDSPSIGPTNVSARHGDLFVLNDRLCAGGKSVGYECYNNATKVWTNSKRNVKGSCTRGLVLKSHIRTFEAVRIIELKRMRADKEDLEKVRLESDMKELKIMKEKEEQQMTQDRTRATMNK